MKKRILALLLTALLLSSAIIPAALATGASFDFSGGCDECGELTGHLETCSQYGADADTAASKPADDSVVICDECHCAYGHTDECSLNPANSISDDGTGETTPCDLCGQTGGHAVGCFATFTEVNKTAAFVSYPVTLYYNPVTQPDNTKAFAEADLGADFTFTVQYSFPGENGVTWYMLDTENWAIFADTTEPYSYIQSTYVTFDLGGGEGGDTTPDTTVDETLDGVNVAIKGDIPAGVELILGAVDRTSVDVSKLGVEDITKVFGAIDITPTNPDGTAWQPAEGKKISVTIGLDVLSDLNGHTFEILHDHNGTVRSLGSAVVTNGKLTVETDGFSVFYVVAGTSDDGSTWNTNITELPGESSTYYVEPGTIIVFNNGTLSGEGTGTIKRNNRTITVSEDAQINDTATFTVNGYSLVFIVADRQTIVSGALQTHPVILSIKTNDGWFSQTNTIPSEPGITEGNYSNITSDYDTSSGANFSDTATGIISSEIGNGLIVSIDGSSTAGIYDATGVECLKYITSGTDGIDWDRVLDVAVNIRARATDGNVVTNQNKSNYIAIPYVIKLMSESGIGWHIDCIVVPKTHITLSYDVNLKNYVVTDATPLLPGAETGLSPLTHTVGSITNVPVDTTVTAKLDGKEYKITFKGWSKDPNATEADIAPGNEITITENTVLYAVWEGKKSIGGLKITKSVSGVATIPEGTEFVFTVTDSLGTKKTVTLSASNNWTATVTDLEPGSCTVTEAKVTIADHVLSSVTANDTDVTNGNAASTSAVTVTITDETVTTVTFTNTYVEDEVTINYVAKTGGSVSRASETVKVVTGNAQGSAATANTGYTFVGWYDNEGCTGTAVSTNPAFTPAKVNGKNVAATYYALFKENEVTINYVAKTGGSVSRASETVKVVTGTVQGSTATAAAGYTFDGWYSDANCTNKVSSSATYVPAKVAATYYAKFVENEVTINYVAKTGGSVDPTSETVKVVTGEVKGSTATAADDYTFVGWYDNVDCTGDALSTNAAFVPSEKVAATYYALFEENEVTIKYVAENGGSVSNDSETVKVLTGNAQGSEATPAENYVFLGWYNEAGELVSSSAAFVPAKVNGKNVAATYTAKFELAVANLTIIKELDKDYENDTLPTDDVFTFTVTSPALTDGEYELSTGGKVTAAGGSLTVTITGAGQVTIRNLPVGTYTVTEADDSDYTVPGAQTATLSSTQHGQVTFTNMYNRHLGDLKITKIIGGEKGDISYSDDVFTFTVRGTNVNLVNGTRYGNYLVENGALTVTITGENSVTIKDLPIGTYTVTEIVPADYTCASPSGPVAVQATGTAAEISFTNVYKRGSLTVTKAVDKAYENDTLPGDSFTFTFSVDTDASYNYVKTTANEKSDGTIKNGDTFTLADGERLVINGLPVHAQYSVTETSDEDYTTTVDGQTGTEASGEITVNGANHAFVNTYKKHLGTLTITKSRSGGSSSDSFIFTVTGPDGFDTTKVVITGGGSVTLKDLPIGTYTVTEDTGWSWRYTSSGSGSDSISLEDLEAAVEITNSYSNDKWLSDESAAENVFNEN